jgi:hypothetical protein
MSLYDAQLEGRGVMARSTYIYAVVQAVVDDHGVMAAFTVKHELVSWLRRQNDTSGVYVLRMRDGYPGCVRVEVNELLGKETA